MEVKRSVNPGSELTKAFTGNFVSNVIGTDALAAMPAAELVGLGLSLYFVLKSGRM